LKEFGNNFQKKNIYPKNMKRLKNRLGLKGPRLFLNKNNFNINNFKNKKRNFQQNENFQDLENFYYPPKILNTNKDNLNELNINSLMEKKPDKHRINREYFHCDKDKKGR
jgi:hypothetical protein